MSMTKKQMALLQQAKDILLQRNEINRKYHNIKEEIKESFSKVKTYRSFTTENEQYQISRVHVMTLNGLSLVVRDKNGKFIVGGNF